MANHQKHPKLAKPKFQTYGSLEMGFVGAPCDLIESLATDVIAELRDHYKSVYIDATHGATQKPPNINVCKDMITHHQVAYDQTLNEWEKKLVLRNIDLALINSNHFDAQYQIVIINQSKEQSLLRLSLIHI